MEEQITALQAQEYLKSLGISITERTIRNYIRSGKLSGRQVRRTTYTTRTEIQRFLNQGGQYATS